MQFFERRMAEGWEKDWYALFCIRSPCRAAVTRSLGVLWGMGMLFIATWHRFPIVVFLDHDIAMPSGFDEYIVSSSIIVAYKPCV